MEFPGLGTFRWSIHEWIGESRERERRVESSFLHRTSIAQEDTTTLRRSIQLLLIPQPLKQNNKETWLLCRSENSSASQHSSDTSTLPLCLQYHPGITVQCATSSATNLDIKTYSPPSLFFRYGLTKEKHAIQLIRTIPQEEDSVMAWDDTVSIPLALSATLSSSQHAVPTLLQSCLKRQLAGIVVWCGANLETTIEFHFEEMEYTFQLEKLYVAERTTGWVRLVPNTNITIIWSDMTDDAVASFQPDCETPQSATYRFLQDNLYCMTKSMPSLQSILLTGPPGVGKTHSVRMLAQTHQLELQIISGGNVVSSHGSANAASKLREIILGASEEPDTPIQRPRIVFLDECDALFAANADTSLHSMASVICYCIDRLDNMLLVAATNRPDDLPNRLRQRFHREMHIAPPNRAERLHLLQSLLPDTLNLDCVADACVGYVAADLAALVARARMLQVHDIGIRNFDDDTVSPVTFGAGVENKHLIQHLRTSMKDVGASALREAALPSTTLSWDDISGNDHIKKMLRQAIEWPIAKRRAFQQLDLKPPRGILLYGPPGCAKTSLAKAAARGRAFCSFSPADVYSTSFVGDAEAVVRRAFATARSAAPCILFFDELDAIVVAEGASSSRGNHVEARVLSTFLNEMDGLDTSDESGSNGVLVLAATNRPSVLDAALLRPGRLDRLIYVPPPDNAARRKILDACTKGTFDEGAVQLSESMTGAEIVGACHEALLECAEAENKSIDCVRDAVNRHLREVIPLLSDAAIRSSYQSFDGATTTLV